MGHRKDDIGIAVVDASGTEWTARNILVIAACFALLALACVLPGLDRAPSAANTSSVRVQQGDTLWDIAEVYRCEGMSTAEAVSLIKSLNGIDGASISPGQRLTVPAPETDGQYAYLR